MGCSRSLKRAGIIEFKEDGLEIKPLVGCHVMCKHMVTFDDMKAIIDLLDLPPDAGLRQMLQMLSKVEGLHRPVRRDEKKQLKEANNKAIKYQLEGAPSKISIKTPSQKAFVLLQCAIGQVFLENSTLRQEMLHMVDQASRILAACKDYMEEVRSKHSLVGVVTELTTSLAKRQPRVEVCQVCGNQHSLVEVCQEDLGDLDPMLSLRQMIVLKEGKKGRIMPWTKFTFTSEEEALPLIVLGSYPAAKCNPNSASEQEIRKELGMGSQQDPDTSCIFSRVLWIDVVNISSDEVNADIDCSKIYELLRKDPDTVKDHHRRLHLQLGELEKRKRLPCVYVAGSYAKRSLTLMIEEGLVIKVLDWPLLGLALYRSLYRSGDQDMAQHHFFGVRGVHPSNHLMSGRYREDVKAFKFAMSKVLAIGEYSKSDNFERSSSSISLFAMSKVLAIGEYSKSDNFERISSSIEKAFMELLSKEGKETVERLKIRLEKRKWLMIELYKDEKKNRFEDKHMKLRHAPLERKSLLEAMETWRSKLGSRPAFIQFIMCGTLYRTLDNADMDMKLKYWLEELGTKSFVTFMCDGVASGLSNDVEGKSDAFEKKLKDWRKKLGTKTSFCATFMCDGVASGLSNDVEGRSDAFKKKLEYWRKELGTDSFVTFMCDGVASGLSNDVEGKSDAFEKKLEDWREKLGTNKSFVTFMCDGVASGLSNDVEGKSDAFEKKLKDWRKKLGTNKSFVTFMCNGVASGLAKDVEGKSDAFEKKLEYWREKLGTDSLFATFMCNGVASGLSNDVEGKSEYWREKLGTKLRHLHVRRCGERVVNDVEGKSDAFEKKLKYCGKSLEREQCIREEAGVLAERAWNGQLICDLHVQRCGERVGEGCRGQERCIREEAGVLAERAWNGQLICDLHVRRCGERVGEGCRGQERCIREEAEVLAGKAWNE